MKKINLFFLTIILALGAIVSSCKPEEEEPTNHFKYEGTEYELTKGILDYYGQWNESPASYNFDVTLLSSGINYDEVSDSYTGQGHVIYFEMFSSSATELVSATYTFNSNETFAPNTFDEGFFAINYVIVNDSGDVEADIASGTVKVDKNGTTYEITIDCTDEFGKKVTGYYKGTLTYYDWSDIYTTKSFKKVRKF